MAGRSKDGDKAHSTVAVETASLSGSETWAELSTSRKRLESLNEHLTVRNNQLQEALGASAGDFQRSAKCPS